MEKTIKVSSVDLARCHVIGTHNRINMDYGESQAMITLARVGASPSDCPMAHLMIARYDVPGLLNVFRSLLNTPPLEDPKQHWLYATFETGGLTLSIGRDYCRMRWSIHIGVRGIKGNHALLSFTDAEVHELLGAENVDAPALQ